MFPPELLPGADEFLSAFWQLSGDRQLGMQAGPIPFASIDRWAARAGIVDPDEFQCLVNCIQVMDAEWLGQGAAPKPATMARPLTMPLFDALFG